MTARRDVVAGLATLPLLSLLPSALARAQDSKPLEGDAIASSAGDIIIHPVNHASLLLAWGDQVVYVDPVGGAARYEGLPKPTAILITHAHGDHFDPPTLTAIAGSVPILTTAQVLERLP
ncbi:MAG: MBL fold metallo-hydrolase, partial [Devosia nanyangense]|nr:MBL fold metallo-hydrolase [Devosia nanyangense]